SRQHLFMLHGSTRLKLHRQFLGPCSNWSKAKKLVVVMVSITRQKRIFSKLSFRCFWTSTETEPTGFSRTNQQRFQTYNGSKTKSRPMFTLTRHAGQEISSTLHMPSYVKSKPISSWKSVSASVNSPYPLIQHLNRT